MQAVRQLIWWLIAGSEGGVNRGRIIETLKKNPSNANQLSESLKLDYKTIRHHLDVLTKNNLVTTIGGSYGKMFFLSPMLDQDYGVFEEIWARIGKNEVKGGKHEDVSK
ncbi:MAG: winged helix-turn-helix domain-containing protein [Methanobacteriota archaeon]